MACCAPPPGRFERRSSSACQSVPNKKLGVLGIGYNPAMPKARVYITLKPTLLDAQGRTIQNALHQLGFEGVQSVRVGKYLEIELAPDGDPHAQIESMCQQLLANPVIEQYRYEVVDE